MDKILSFLGLLNRGGKTLVGPALEKSLAKVHFLFLAKDASRLEQWLRRDLALPLDVTYTKVQLGEALGFPELSAIGITDNKAAKAMKMKIEGERR